MVFVILEERPGLGAKPLEAVRRGEARKVHGCLTANLVFEISVNRLALLFLDQFHERAQTAANGFQHRRGHVLPPFVSLNLLNQRHLLMHHRDAGLFL